MSDKGRFDLEKSRFKQRFPNLPQEQFQYLLKKEKPELYKTAVREGWLKVTPESTKSPQPKVENNGKKDTGAAKSNSKPEGRFKRFATPEDTKGSTKPSSGKFKGYAVDYSKMGGGAKPRPNDLVQSHKIVIQRALDKFYKGTPIGKYSSKDVLEDLKKSGFDAASFEREANKMGYKGFSDPRINGLTSQQVNSIKGKTLSIDDVKKLFSGGKNPTDDEIEKLYSGKKKTISKEDILGKGAKATEGAAKATSKEGLLSRFGQLGQKGAQIGQKIISNPVVQKGARIGQKVINNPIVRGTGGVIGKAAYPLAIGTGIYNAGITASNWNAAGSSPTSRFFDAIGNHEQAQIRREADAPYGSYTSNSVKAPTEAEQAELVNKYNAGQPQANMSEEDALKMNLYGTTNVTGDSVPVDDEGIFEDYTGSTGGAVGGDGGDNNNGGISGGVPIGGSAAQAATYQPSGILPASPEYYADEAYLANIPFKPSEYTQQSLDNLSNGYVKQADIYEKLNRAQQAYNDAVAAQTDPRYQGGLIPAAGYNVNPVLLQDAQSVDRVAQLYNTMYGENNQIGATQNVLDNAQANYEVGIANQAGVPYADYKDAMLKRREQEITARAQDIKNQLEFQKNQTADLKERRELAQKQYEVDVQAYRELMKARLDNRRDIEKQGMSYAQAVDTAAISGQYGNQRADIEGKYGNQREKIAGQYGLRREQMEAQSNRDIALINNEAKALLEATKQGDSTAYINAVSNLGTMLSGMSPQMVEAFLYGNPTIREAMFGKGVTPEQAMIMLGRYQNSGNQGTGFWNWLRGNN